jgi:two-component system chemotaxis sensor kinase CheA
MPNQEKESDLRERIDDLSTRLLIGVSGPRSPGGSLKRFKAALADLARQAGDAGYGEAARIAQELSAGRPAMSRLQEGLVRLQQAVSEGAVAVQAAAAAEVETAGEAAVQGSEQTGTAAAAAAAGAAASAAPPAPARAPAARPLAEDPELVADFILESREHLTSIEQQFLVVERDPANMEAIHSIFRGFHTIKGLVGFLEFKPIHEVAHEMETALNLVREGKLAITRAVIDVGLACVDYLARSITGVESGAGCERLSGHDQLLERIRSLIREEPGVPVTEPAVRAATEPESEVPPADDVKRPAAAAESSSVRVDTAKLDYLVDMVGEMVIAQSLMRHNEAFSAAGDPRLHRNLSQLTRITGEVQRTAMAMRMVPIGLLFNRTARQIRDLSRKVGKQVELVTHGEDTQLDKTIAEELADPLVHMVRNAIDHGIESPDERQAAGKTAEAKITLAAYHRAGQIVIEVSDDGRGLDSRKILAKARQKALVEDGAHLSEGDIFRLIMEPGFSTAELVTDISGRGVGMDVVRRQVEKLRGRIEIRSRTGEGTAFLLKLPLTLAIIDGLVVAIGPHRYIVPLFAVREMFRPAAESIFTVQNRQEMAMVRGRLLPVLRLYKRFGLVPRTEDPCQALLIVAETEGQPFCLMVDDLVGKQEVVIKSLGEGVGKVRGVAGGAILGDGRVGLILDVGGLWGAHANA